MAATTDSLKIVLVGFGSVGVHLAELLKTLNQRAASLQIVVIGVSDSQGVQHNPKGIDLEELTRLKAEGKSVAEAQNKSLDSSESLASSTDYDVLVDLSPGNIDVGLYAARIALKQGRHVVFANKAPLVKHYSELFGLATKHGASMKFSATVCGGLPVVNIGQRDLVGAAFHDISGIFNSTSNYVISQIEAGNSKELAISEAQRRGIAEADPSYDLEGIDSASKLVIITNSILDIPATIDDVDIGGINDVTKEAVDEAAKEGCCIRLVARATSDKTSRLGYNLSVKAEKLPQASFLGACVDTEMCVIFQTDIYETQSFKTNETGVTPTSAAVLRDLLSLER